MSERRGFVRREGELFWLDLGTMFRFRLEDRANQLWGWFEDREVIAIDGDVYQPADGDDLFFVPHDLRVAEQQRGTGPYFSVGVARWFEGELVVQAGSAGSKQAGTVTMFRTEGRDLAVFGSDLPIGVPLRVLARELEPDLSYAARGAGPDLWIDKVE